MTRQVPLHLSDRAVRRASLAIVAGSLAALAAVLVVRSMQDPAPPGEQDATITPSPATSQGLQALTRMNGLACDSVASATRISTDDWNLECMNAGGARRAMYLVNLRTGQVR